MHFPSIQIKETINVSTSFSKKSSKLRNTFTINPISDGI